MDSQPACPGGVIERVLAAAALLWAACSSEAEPTRGLDASMAPQADAELPAPEAALDAAPRAVSYQRDIRPRIELHCLPCHASEGVAPLALDTWAGVQAVERAAVAAVTRGAMPPFPADRGCRDYRGHDLDAAGRDAFAAWAQADFPEGDPADYVPPTRAELGPPDLTFEPAEAYLPPANGDEYRCFVLDALAADQYVRALRIATSRANEVHHAQLHRLTPAQLPAVRKLDDEAPGLGYPCPAGTGVESELLYSYRPGTDAVVFAAGEAAFVAAGSTLALQVHYNTELTPPAPEQTTVSLWTLPAGQLPDYVLVRTGSTAVIDIPAGAVSSLASADSSMYMIGAFGSFFGFGGVFIPGELAGIAPHAHQLATRMHAELGRSDGSTSCLVDVPRWDFHTQLDYLFARPEPYTAEDRLRISCEYDNSAEHQPLRDGQPSTPRDVVWGERSSDEMCLFYLWLRFERPAFEAAQRALRAQSN